MVKGALGREPSEDSSAHPMTAVTSVRLRGAWSWGDLLLRTMHALAASVSKHTQAPYVGAGLPYRTAPRSGYLPGVYPSRFIAAVRVCLHFQ